MLMTESAVTAVKELMDSQKEEIAENDLVPIITWIFNRQGEATDPGPMLGMIERSRLSVSLDAFSDGQFTVYNGLPDELRLRFQSRPLDYRNGKFEFL